ncbi:Ribosome-associated protein L7Ae-like protein [compost metagenome]|jgi:large subunit ribosomal protein L7A|uniref:Large subunit ribosomal protein L7A n=1 Tax=Clostridium intestinale DSM 6191 TaxID=1121320 RepID=A0A1M6FES5_9CLOT|nr:MULTISPECIES: ribosomal L7Ae/L30e/S12e/Gadd45 family protein [Clostridium]WRY50176.1 ribosomal L7Ae/L30e/S12e/Gadd45 family protein [Clostridium intestinale]SHI96238.1 large subunit ribosomal protein L7A [Clostridium intestinale DSM 6191]
MIDRLIGKKLIGIKQCAKAMKNGSGTKLYVAKDSDERLILPLIELATEKNIQINYVDTMRDLGKMCSIEVGATSALMLE